MEYRFLGRTGLQVSALCLGAMTFGREATEEVSFQLLDRFCEAGGNFIDTADVYGKGLSEEILGRWLKTRRRDDLVIATKLRKRTGKAVNDEGLSRKHIVAAVEASLSRLGTDYIDLYQTHEWWNQGSLEETLGTLNSLVTSGKVRYLGASNYLGWQLQKSIDTSRRQGWESFASLQPLYNLLERGVEWELMTICQNEGLGILPFSPLGGGWLSGKYQRGMTGAPANTRVDAATRQGYMESWQHYDNETTWSLIDTLLAIARQLGKSPAQVALNWLLRRPGVTAPIVGARNLQQLEENLGAVDWSLDAEQVSRLNSANPLPKIYPY